MHKREYQEGRSQQGKIVFSEEVLRGKAAPTGQAGRESRGRSVGASGRSPLGEQDTFCVIVAGLPVSLTHARAPLPLPFPAHALTRPPPYASYL